MPTQTRRGSLGSMAMAPIDCTPARSKTGRKVVPPSVDFHTPPLAAPAKIVVLPSTLRAATADTRPLITAAPTLRAPRPESTPASTRAGPAAAGAAGAAARDTSAAAGRAGRAGGAAAPGKRKVASSSAAFASARSTTARHWRGAFFGPPSSANGNHTPSTCS
ncbi:MAG: hypothetical protein QM704_25990 [Anaeromyxobacteraceae bacterium]